MVGVRSFVRTSAFLLLAASCAVAANQWPQWQGPMRNGLNQETDLLEAWPEGGPRQVWFYRQCGTGYGGPAVVDGRLYILGARDGTTELQCLDANQGTEIWAVPLGAEYENNWGNGPRSTPTVDGNRVYALSGRGDLVCVDAKDGREVWRTTMQQLGGEIPKWGYCESVLIDGPLVVCTPGGEQGAVAALNKGNGSVVWQSAEVTDAADYSSVIRAEPHGEPQYIQLMPQRLVGLSPADGRLLWDVPWPGQVAVIPTPLFHDGLVYATSGYGAGCMLVDIGPNNRAATVYENKTMKNHHGGVIRVGDHVYGYSDGVGWVCQEFHTGKLIWRERSALEKGAIGYADGMLYCIGEDDGEVVLIEASPEGWKEHGRFKLTPQTDIRSPRGGIWTHPVIVNGKLFLRDQELLFCYDVRAR